MNDKVNGYLQLPPIALIFRDHVVTSGDSYEHGERVYTDRLSSTAGNPGKIRFSSSNQIWWRRPSMQKPLRFYRSRDYRLEEKKRYRKRSYGVRVKEPRRSESFGNCVGRRRVPPNTVRSVGTPARPPARYRNLWEYNN